MLSVQIENIGEMAVIQCEGRIVRSEAAFKLREAVNSQRDARIIVLDLSEVSAIEGGGLGMLVFLQRWVHDHDTRLKLFNPPPVCAGQAGARQLDVRVRHGYARRNDGSPGPCG